MSFIRRLLVFALALVGLALLAMGPRGLRGHAPPMREDLAFLVIATVCLSLAAALMAPRSAGRGSWIGINAAVAVVGIGALIWASPKAGVLAVAAFVLLIVLPVALGSAAYRLEFAGKTEAAVPFAWLAGLLHPSAQARFAVAFLRARAIKSTEGKIAAYRALAQRASPEQAALLNCWIALARHDWQGLLQQIRGGTGATSITLRGLEFRCLGELGRIDEMVTSYASARRGFARRELRGCQLFVLAFSGRVDGVRAILAGPLRTLAPAFKAYWIFVATQAAGIDDQDVRHDLTPHACSAEDETFRTIAQRHLAKAPGVGGVVLSPDSLATIAAIEESLEKTRRRGAQT
jgi:hypothetical protein